jgi:hypothetical protein
MIEVISQGCGIVHAAHALAMAIRTVNRTADHLTGWPGGSANLAVLQVDMEVESAGASKCDSGRQIKDP